MGTRLATLGLNKFRFLSGVGIEALSPFGFTIFVAKILKIKDPRPYDPTIIPVIRPLLFGKYSILHTRGTIYVIPVPIPLNIPYRQINAARLFVKLEAKIPEIDIKPPKRIICLGFHPFYLKR